MSSKQTEIWVSCAIIEHNGRVLAARRNRNTSNAGKWEFPGGKLEEGETAPLCLEREIVEELAITITIQQPLPAVVHSYPDKTIRLFPFVCSYPGGDIKASEHQQTGWFCPDELSSLDWSEADIKVLNYYLENHLDDSGVKL